MCSTKHISKLVFLQLCSMTTYATGYMLSDLQRLKKELLIDQSYDRSMRPVLNHSLPIEVCIKILLLSLIVVLFRLLCSLMALESTGSQIKFLIYIRYMISSIL